MVPVFVARGESGGGHWGRTQDPTPIRVSDVATRRQFHRCGIYDLFLRNWGIEHTLAVRLRRGREVHDFACYRKRTDFSERDRLVLDLFRRYLSILIAPAVAKLPLTSRELEILELVALGKSNAEAAEILVVAPGTIKKHLDNIYEKVGVRTRTAAAIRATGQRPRWPDLTSPRANDTAIAAGELVTAELERRHRP
jgi:DNA-binding CsgD family transcriptional regulator